MPAKSTPSGFSDVVDATATLRKDAPLLGHLRPHDQVRALSFLADNLSVYAIDPVRYIAGDGLLAARLNGRYSAALLRRLVESVLVARPHWVSRPATDVAAGKQARMWAAAEEAAAAERSAGDKDWDGVAEALRRVVLIDPDYVIVRGRTAETMLTRLLERTTLG